MSILRRVLEPSETSRTSKISAFDPQRGRESYTANWAIELTVLDHCPGDSQHPQSITVPGDQKTPTILPGIPNSVQHCFQESLKRSNVRRCFLIRFIPLKPELQLNLSSKSSARMRKNGWDRIFPKSKKKSRNEKYFLYVLGIL